MDAESSVQDDDAGPVGSTNPSCGIDQAPRWSFQLYDNAVPVATPTRSGVSGAQNMPVHIDVKGTVVSSGDGVPSKVAARELTGLAAPVRHLRVQTQERVFTFVTHGIPNFGAGLSAGTRVELSHHDDTLAYVVAPRGPVTTSLRTQDKTLFHYAFSAFEINAPEGFTVGLGEDYCSAHDRCRTWTGHALEITDASNMLLSLRPGMSGTLSSSTWYVGSVALEGLRHMPSEADRTLSCSESTHNATELLMLQH